MLPPAERILAAQMTRILLIDRNLVINYANLEAQQLLAQGARKVIGSPLPTLIDYCSLDFEALQKNLKAAHGFTENEVIIVVAEQYHTLTLCVQPLSSELFLLEFSPLDNQRRLEQTGMQQAQIEAATDLIRNLAHEIKNPLGGLRGAAQLLAKHLPDPSLHDYTQLIIEQTDRLNNLVNRLLGPQQLGKHVTQSIHQVVERVYRLLSLEKAEHITLIRDYDPSLPDFSYDPEQIEQVLLNIGRNALQALVQKNSTITLRTRSALQVLLHDRSYRLAARIDIEDNGPGVAPHLQTTLFYPKVSSHPNGSGLGLSIARKLIEQHHGKIEFTSWPGHTEFSVFLPIRQ